MKPGPNLSGTAYLPELDGLRAVAAIAVVLFHLPVAAVPSGTQGVDVFFVITGYLMGRAVLAKRRQLDLTLIRNFILRRIWRLFPVLLVVTLFYSLVLVTAGYPFDPMAEVLPPLLYVSNLTTIWGRPPHWFLHTWTLSLEFQFYLLLPVFALVTRRITGSNLLAGLLVVYVSLTLMRAYCFGQPGVSIAQSLHPVWQSTGMILGMSIAILPMIRETSWMRVLGPAALFVIIFGFNHSNATLAQSSLWMSLTEIATGVLVWRIVRDPGVVIRTLLGGGVMSTLGTWSYGIYLWHFPIVILSVAAFTPSVAILTTLVASTALAALTYHMIEVRFSKGSIRRG